MKRNSADRATYGESSVHEGQQAEMELETCLERNFVALMNHYMRTSVRYVSSRRSQLLQTPPE